MEITKFMSTKGESTVFTVVSTVLGEVLPLLYTSSRVSEGTHILLPG